jgi:hypothetical protein
MLPARGGAGRRAPGRASVMSKKSDVASDSSSSAVRSAKHLGTARLAVQPAAPHARCRLGHARRGTHHAAEPLLEMLDG